jgi:hypothetical protein
MHKNATKCYETLSKWCENKYEASKIIDTFETYHGSRAKVEEDPPPGEELPRKSTASRPGLASFAWNSYNTSHLVIGNSNGSNSFQSARKGCKLDHPTEQQPYRTLPSITTTTRRGRMELQISPIPGPTTELYQGGHTGASATRNLHPLKLYKLLLHLRRTPKAAHDLQPWQASTVDNMTQNQHWGQK